MPYTALPDPAGKTRSKKPQKPARARSLDKNADAPFRVNVPKLLRELAVITAVILTVVFIKVLPDILARPVYEDHSEYKYYFRLAMNYDASKGPDENLEQKLIDATENQQIKFDHLYYNRIALAEYYIKNERYEKALELLWEARNMTANTVHAKFLASRFITCFTALGDEESRERFANEYGYYERIGVPDDV